MFSLSSSEDVFAEVLANMRKNAPDAPGYHTSHRLELIRGNIDDIVRDFPGRGPFTGTDQGDYHVHAAATAAQADVILTSNKASDITTTPDDEVYEIQTPDEFFTLVVTANPRCLIPIVREQLAYWSGKPSKFQLDEMLHKAGCATFSTCVRKALTKIALAP